MSKQDKLIREAKQAEKAATIHESLMDHTEGEEYEFHKEQAERHRHTIARCAKELS